MKRIFILLIYFLICCFNISAQDWTFFDKTVGSLENRSENIYAEHDGFYVAGYYVGNYSIDTFAISSLLGPNAIALAHYNYDGHLQSLKSYFGGGISNSRVSYAQGKFGEEYFAFTFQDSVAIGDTTFYSFGKNDIAVCKLVNDSVQWAKQYGSKEEDGFGISGDFMQIDNNGDLLLIGTYGDTAQFDNNVINVNSTGRYSFFLKMDTAGSIIWFKKLGGADVTVRPPPSIQISDSNNYFVLTTVEAPANINFGSSASTAETLPFFGSATYLVKYNELGEYQWLYRYDNPFTGQICLPYNMILDQDENIYICGRAKLDQGPIYLSNQLITSLILSTSNTWSSYLIKVNSTGTAQWFSQGLSSSNDYCADVALNKQGEVFLTGYFSESLALGTGLVTSNGNEDIYLSCYDTSGQQKWLKNYGGTELDNVKEIVIDSNGHLILMGRVSSTPAYFDNDIYMANFNNQLFIARMTPYAIGVEDLSKDETIVVYPNPSNGILQVSFPRNMYTDLSMYNSIGQQVRYYKLNKNVTNTAIDCSALASGTYFLQCSNDNEFTNKKIIIE